MLNIPFKWSGNFKCFWSGTPFLPVSEPNIRTACVSIWTVVMNTKLYQFVSSALCIQEINLEKLQPEAQGRRVYVAV